MKIAYQPTAADRWDLVKYRWRHDNRTTRSWAISTIVPPVAFFLVFVFVFPLRFPTAVVALLALAFGAFMFFYRISIMRRAILRAAAKTEAQGEKLDLVIDAGGIRFIGTLREKWHSWRQVHEVAQNDKHILLFHSRSGAWIVAKRNFASDREARAFYEAAKAYWRNGQKEVAPAEAAAPEDMKEDGEETQEVSFAFTLEDYGRLADTLAQRRAKTRYRGVFNYLTGVAAVALGAYCLWESHRLALASSPSASTYLFRGVTFSAFGALLIWLETPGFFRGIAARTIGLTRDVAKRHLVCVTPAHLTISTPLSVSRLRWPAVQSIEEKDQYLIVVEEASAAQPIRQAALYIPRSAFLGQEEESAFLQCALRYWRQAHLDSDIASGAAPSAWPPAPTVTGKETR